MQIPEGFKLVPIDCTDSIGEAIAAQARCCGGIANDIWEAAMAAAPEVPEIELDPVAWSRWSDGDMLRYVSEDGHLAFIRDRITLGKDYAILEAPDIEGFLRVADDHGHAFVAQIEDFDFIARKDHYRPIGGDETLVKALEARIVELEQQVRG